MGLLGRILRRKPAGAGDVDAATRRALARSLEQDWDGVESELAAVARARSASSDVYLALARVYRVRGEIGRAIRVHQNLLLRKDLSADERLEALAERRLQELGTSATSRELEALLDLVQVDVEGLGMSSVQVSVQELSDVERVVAPGLALRPGRCTLGVALRRAAGERGRPTLQMLMIVGLRAR